MYLITLITLSINCFIFYVGEFCQFNKDTGTCPASSNMILRDTENPCGSRGVCKSEDKTSGGQQGFKCECAAGTDTEYCKLSARSFPEGSYVAMPGIELYIFFISYKREIF